MYPVLSVLDELRVALRENPVVMLEAPTGAGKSTVLPLELCNENWCDGRKILMLEPRRLAARAVAMRMASLRDEDVGDTVGYRVRFETRVSRKTKVEVVTEGILTRMIQSDNSLEGVAMVIFDEFHERNLTADLALALALQVQQVLRPDLRILIMSATLDGQTLTSVFPNAPVIRCEGRQFPVEIVYSDDASDEAVFIRVTRAIRKSLRDQKGDVLVFLPGSGEINRTMELLESVARDVAIYRLYGDLSYKQQQQALTPDEQGRRKIILSTSIAETSLTIENVSVVVDSGLSRVPRFDPRSGLTRLHTEKVTADSAAQRAGRAGRTGPGVCYRLWSRREQEFLIPQRTPEILQADLAPTLLELAAWGTLDPAKLTWITPPPPGSVSQAFSLLVNLGAVEDQKITTRGRQMVSMPTHPRISHLLLEASSDKAKLAVACDMAAILEERDPLPAEKGADLGLRVEALNRYRLARGANNPVLERVARLASNWRKIMQAGGSDVHPDPHSIGSLLLLAYPDRVARQMSRFDDRYKLVNGRTVRLPKADPLVHYEWLVAAHVDAREGDGRIFLAAPIDVADLLPLAKEEDVVRWDDAQGRLSITREQKIGPLIISSDKGGAIPDKLRAGVLCRMIRDKGLDVLGWDDDQRQLQARMMSLRLWRPEESWPDIGDDALLDSLEDWLAPALASVSRQEELSKIKPVDLIIGRLPWSLVSRIDVLAPRRMNVPSGSSIRIRYAVDGSLPVMEVRLQEIFGWKQIPLVNDGNVPLVLHLLSPGYRAVQITRDLQSFWSNTYPEVRKELRRRYPKHSWPDDPLTAQAVRGARKRKE